MYKGFVENHGPLHVSGWCVDVNNPSKPVSLDLQWQDRTLRRVLASIERQDILRGYQSPGAGFNLRINESLVKLLPKGSKIRVRLPDGTFLPLLNSEKFVSFGTADDNGAELNRKLDSGYVIDKWGQIKLPFRAMSQQHRARYALGMRDIAKYFQHRFGYALFPHYGTLLGYARGNSFLPHDDDTDMSFIIRADAIEDVVSEFFRIARVIKEDGHQIGVTAAGQMHVNLRGSAEIGTDIFASWITSDLQFYTYFGVGGRLNAVPNFFVDNLEGQEVLIPDAYEAILALTYGPTWKIPDPDFQWHKRPDIAAKMTAIETLGKVILSDPSEGF